MNKIFLACGTVDLKRKHSKTPEKVQNKQQGKLRKRARKMLN